MDGEPAGRIYIRLRGDMVPLTAENFLGMCKDDPQRTLQNTGLTKTKTSRPKPRLIDLWLRRDTYVVGFHRALPGALIQGGLLPAASSAAPEYIVGEGFGLKPDGSQTRVEEFFWSWIGPIGLGWQKPKTKLTQITLSSSLPQMQPLH